MDEGALWLSSCGCDRLAAQHPHEYYGHQDRHKAPTLPRIHPLSLQNGEDWLRRKFMGAYLRAACLLYLLTAESYASARSCRTCVANVSSPGLSTHTQYMRPYTG